MPRLAIGWWLLLVACSGPMTGSDGGPREPPSVHVRTRSGDTFSDVTGPLLFGEPITVRVEHVAPDAQVTVRFHAPNLESHATFRADSSGVVDTARDAPLSGSYEGVDGDGLVWSMQRADIREPELVALALRVIAEVDARELGNTVVERFLVGDGVRVSQVRDDGLYGTFFEPAGEGPHPAILVVGGSQGGIEWGYEHGAYYASLGYAALGLAYFEAPGLPDALSKIPLEYFGTALEWLGRQSSVDNTRIAIEGVSRGGELGLILASRFPQVKGVIAILPSGVQLAGYTASGDETASWTWMGQPLPYLPSSGPVPTTTESDGVMLLDYGTWYAQILDDAAPDQLAAATVHVEDAQGPLLLLASANDRVAPGCRLAEIAWQRLQQMGHTQRFPDAYVCFEGAGHALQIPGLSTVGSDRIIPVGSTMLEAAGGTAQANARAQRDANTRLRAFLRALFTE